MTPAITTAINDLERHPLAEQLGDLSGIRRFMEHHVYAVWDFMALLKSLQADLAPAHRDWVPPKDAEGAALINAIVCDEESDEIEEGRHLSHFAWYLEAMQEIGADRRGIDGFLHHLTEGRSPRAAILASDAIPSAARRFLLGNAQLLTKPLAVRAAVFLYGREEIIPRLFAPLVATLRREGFGEGFLVRYLERHIELDGDDHGPKAHGLLDRLLAASPNDAAEAEASAMTALALRSGLWGAVAQSHPLAN